MPLFDTVYSKPCFCSQLHLGNVFASWWGSLDGAVWGSSEDYNATRINVLVGEGQGKKRRGIVSWQLLEE